MRSMWRVVVLASLVLASLVLACNRPTAPPRDEGFTLRVSDPAPAAVYAGETTTVFLTAHYSTSFTGGVAFSMNPLTGFTYTLRTCYARYGAAPFGPGPGSGCEAVVAVDRSVPPATYALSFRGTASGLPPRDVQVGLTVLAPRPLPEFFMVTPSTSEAAVARDDSVDIVFLLTERPSGAPDVTFSTLGGFVGLSLRWIPSPIVEARSNEVRMRVLVDRTATLGVRSYFVTAQLPGLPTRTRMIRVTVVP